MAEIITCPSCQRQLQVPENFFGQLVQCPQCQHQFEAQPPAPAAPTPSPASAVASEQDEENRPRRRRFEDDDDRRPRRRDYLQPHRGTLVLTLGILSLCVCGVALITGSMAWIFGNTDLKAMDDGRMDPSGREQTKTGKLLGIIGLMLNLLIIGGYCLFVIVIVMMARVDGPQRRRG